MDSAISGQNKKDKIKYLPFTFFLFDILTAQLTDKPITK